MRALILVLVCATLVACEGTSAISGIYAVHAEALSDTCSPARSLGPYDNVPLERSVDALRTIVPRFTRSAPPPAEGYGIDVEDTLMDVPLEGVRNEHLVLDGCRYDSSIILTRESAAALTVTVTEAWTPGLPCADTEWSLMEGTDVACTVIRAFHYDQVLSVPRLGL